MMKKIRIALLISGGGTTAEAIIRAVQSKKLKGVDPVVVIASRSDAKGIARAKTLGIPVRVVDPKKFSSSQAFGKKLLATLQSFRVDVVSQNGWLPLTPAAVIGAYEGRIVNQHPGPLDPGRADFGGKGMYGKRVTCARLVYAWMMGKHFWTEATVHLVTEEFDTGRVLRRVRIPLPKQKKAVKFSWLQHHQEKIINTTNQVASVLLPIEHENVIQTLQMLVTNKTLKPYIRQAPLVASKTISMLGQAKKMAIELFPKG